MLPNINANFLIPGKEVSSHFYPRLVAEQAMMSVDVHVDEAGRERKIVAIAGYVRCCTDKIWHVNLQRCLALTEPCFLHGL